ncbi:hypothetical protein GCM10010285_63230 [Streptomyces pseudogriseolus]|uniref:Uncharacterized protein n=1 Tax=Streptomyces pseudogriseolus TaxID=36817 RepID=A0ABQ2TP90_STREZ|nr:hypothetical protein GCM10010285_63230 [Streptomyces rubiginosus]
MEVGDAVSRLPCRCGSHGSGGQQQTGEGMAGAKSEGGPGSAVLRYPGRVYAVRHPGVSRAAAATAC